MNEIREEIPINQVIITLLEINSKYFVWTHYMSTNKICSKIVWISMKFNLSMRLLLRWQSLKQFGSSSVHTQWKLRYGMKNQRRACTHSMYIPYRECVWLCVCQNGYVYTVDIASGNSVCVPVMSVLLTHKMFSMRTRYTWCFLISLSCLAFYFWFSFKCI